MFLKNTLIVYDRKLIKVNLRTKQPLLYILHYYHLKIIRLLLEVLVIIKNTHKKRVNLQEIDIFYAWLIV